MKLEKHTDYELYKKQSRLIALFIIVLLVGLVAMLISLSTSLITTTKDLQEELELAKGVVPELVERPYENQKEPAELCGLEVVTCNEETTEDLETPKWTSVSVCSTDNGFKSYMDYRMITDTSSKQYKLQQDAYTNEHGLREYNGLIMIAIAGFNVGDELKLILDNGSEVDVIVGDLKANTRCLHPDGSMVEFIVYTPQLSNNVRLSGNVSELYEGKIIDIKIKDL